MRLDEFSAPADIDAVFTQAERTRFNCVGFDIASDSPTLATASDEWTKWMAVLLWHRS